MCDVTGCSLIMMKGIMLPAHFSLNCHISHLQSIQDTPTVTDTSTQKVTLLTAHQLLPVISSRRTSAGVTDCLTHPRDGLFPPHSHAQHISAITAQHTQTIMYLLLILTFLSLTGLFLVFHSMACAFFLLFLRIWMSMPHWKTNKKTNKKKEEKKGTKKLQKKKKNMFPNCVGWGDLGGWAQH